MHLLFAGVAAFVSTALAAEPTTARASSCAHTSSTGQIERLLLDAELAYARLDLPGFHSAALSVASVLPCLGESILPTTAARYHRIRGMYHFLARDHEAAARDFAAARWIEPAWRFPDTIVPPTNPLVLDYTVFPVEGARFVPAARPEAGRVSFDGLPVLLRPAEWPTIVQLFDGTGAVIYTACLAPGEPMPAYKGRKERRPPPPRGKGR